MTQWERDKATLDPLIAQLSDSMVSLIHLEYVIETLSKHYVPTPNSRMNSVGIYGILASCARNFHNQYLKKE